MCRRPVVFDFCRRHLGRCTSEQTGQHDLFGIKGKDRNAEQIEMLDYKQICDRKKGSSYLVQVTRRVAMKKPLLRVVITTLSTDTKRHAKIDTIPLTATRD